MSFLPLATGKIYFRAASANDPDDPNGDDDDDDHGSDYDELSLSLSLFPFLFSHPSRRSLKCSYSIIVI